MEIPEAPGRPSNPAQTTGAQVAVESRPDRRRQSPSRPPRRDARARVRGTADWNSELAGALEAGRFGVLPLDDDGRILHANQPAAELLGRNLRTLRGRRLVEFVHPDERGWAESDYRSLLQGELDRLRQELRVLTADHRERWTELSSRAINRASDDPARVITLLDDVSDRLRREAELQRLADSDPLTGLLNRRRFSAELNRHLARTDRYGPRGALLLIDIDRLKEINDNDGHLAGDRAIVTTATAIRSHTRSSDVPARIGGDEFAILLPAATSEQATAVAAALSAAIASSDSRRHCRRALTVSVGVAAVTHGTSAESLLEEADRAMYRIKHAGGNGHALALRQRA